MKNWKTTLLGVLAGVLMTFGGYADARAHGGAPITVGNVLPGIVVAALGAAAKDHSN